MRAAVLREYNADLSIEEVPVPECPENGVVLKVMACGVCRSDWHGWTGEHPRVKPGQIGGHEYCGEVVEAGPRATWKVGDVLVAPFILACGSSVLPAIRDTATPAQTSGFRASWSRALSPNTSRFPTTTTSRACRTPCHPRWRRGSAAG
jgi:threonine dehydrogenase-like Zn-dependent dehydrogenase